MGALVIAGLMLGGVGYYLWYVALGVPSNGRKMQLTAWKPIADRRGGKFQVSPGGATFHSMAIQVGESLVSVTVADRALIDKAIIGRGREMGGWRTFLHADVRGGNGPAFVLVEVPGVRKLVVGDEAFQKVFDVVPLNGTGGDRIAPLFTGEVCQAAHGARGFSSVSAGPSFITMEIPGVCANPALLEAAITLMGRLASPQTDSARVSA